MSAVTCPGCHRSYAARLDGQPRQHKPCGTQVAGRYEVALPWHKPPLTANQQRRMHPLAEAKLKATMLSAARWTIRAAHLPDMVYADVTLHWRMPDRRTRDADGAMPTLKVVLDALVKEGVLYDDSWVEVRHCGVTAHPPQPGIPGGLWLQIDRIEESA